MKVEYEEHSESRQLKGVKGKAESTGRLLSLPYTLGFCLANGQKPDHGSSSSVGCSVSVSTQVLGLLPGSCVLGIESYLGLSSLLWAHVYVSTRVLGLLPGSCVLASGSWVFFLLVSV